jgi:hypothetical protein
MREDNEAPACFAQRRVPSLSCGAFDAVAACELDFDDLAEDAPLARNRAAEARPCRRIRAELMIDVQRLQSEAQTPPQPRKHVEKNDRVDAAAQAQQQAVARCDRVLEARGNVRREIVSGDSTSLRLP